MPNEPKSDDALSQRMEEVLDDEHKLRLIWVNATGLTYDDAVKAFNDAKNMAVLELVTDVITRQSMTEDAKLCTCPHGWFPKAEALKLEATPGSHHYHSCARNIA